jgi:hypothetical protein
VSRDDVRDDRVSLRVVEADHVRPAGRRARLLDTEALGGPAEINDLWDRARRGDAGQRPALVDIQRPAAIRRRVRLIDCASFGGEWDRETVATHRSLSRAA